MTEHLNPIQTTGTKTFSFCLLGLLGNYFTECMQVILYNNSDSKSCKTLTGWGKMWSKFIILAPAAHQMSTLSQPHSNPPQHRTYTRRTLTFCVDFRFDYLISPIHIFKKSLFSCLATDCYSSTVSVIFRVKICTKYWRNF